MLIMENRIKFTEEQLKYAIESKINEDSGVNQLFEMVVNSLMYSEREAFLKEHKGETKGNGYRTLYKPGINNKLKLAIPRDRMGVFQPLLLGIMNHQDETIKDLTFSLYGKGLTTRQISDVLEDIYGKSYSSSTVSNITNEFSEQMDAWLNRSLDSYYPIVYIDATHFKIRRDRVASEAFYVVMGVKSDYTREILTIVNMPTESASGWKEVLDDLKERGLEDVQLFVSDDLTGLKKSIDLSFPEARRQLCTLHFQKSLSRKVRVSERSEFIKDLKEIINPTINDNGRDISIKMLTDFLNEWQVKYPSFKRYNNQEYMEQIFEFKRYNRTIQQMIYTTNWIERLNKSFKRTLKIRNSMPSPESALKLMCAVSIEMEDKVYKYPIYNFKFEDMFKRT